MRNVDIHFCSLYASTSNVVIAKRFVSINIQFALKVRYPMKFTYNANSLIHFFLVVD